MRCIFRYPFQTAFLKPFAPKHDWRGKAILFGGTDLSGYLNDTWAYDYATNAWTNRAPASSPYARYGHALAYDASAGKVVLFGGLGVDFPFNDTWALTMGGGATQSLSYDFTVGWNLIGVPVVTPSTPAQVFGSLGSFYLFEWSPLQQTYLIPIALSLGKAYWLKVFQAVTGFTIFGQAGVTKSVLLTSGWNMIASPLLDNVNWSDVRIIKGAETKTIPHAAAAGWMQEGIWRWGDPMTMPTLSMEFSESSCHGCPELSENRKTSLNYSVIHKLFAFHQSIGLLLNGYRIRKLEALSKKT